jgi:hypothetical protein
VLHDQAADELRKTKLRGCKQAGRHKKRPAFAVCGVVGREWRVRWPDFARIAA